MAEMTELSDIKTQFYAIAENYSAVYANYKANPNLPSAMKDHDKMESNLTALYRRMFAFQAGVEKGMEQLESRLNESTNDNAKLNAILAKRVASINGKDAMIVKRAPVRESFVVSGLGGDGPPSPSPVEISMVDEARSIEKTAYAHSIARIVYLLVGIAVVSYFILQTVGDPDSTILTDAKIKAEQLRNNLSQMKYDAQTMRPQTMRPQTMGPQTMRPQTIGPQTMRPQTIGPQTMGPQPIQPIQLNQPIQPMR
jgi:hypothetical protein